MVDGRVLGGVRRLVVLQEGEVALGSHVHVPPVPVKVVGRRVRDSLVGLRHVLDELRLDLRLDVDLKLADLRLRHLFERGLWPWQEPVDGAAVDQAGEHARAVAELASHGREAEHEVQVRADAVEEEGPQLGRGRLLLGALLLESVAHLAEYRVHLIAREEIG